MAGVGCEPEIPEPEWRRFKLRMKKLNTRRRDALIIKEAKAFTLRRTTRRMSRMSKIIQPLRSRRQKLRQILEDILPPTPKPNRGPIPTGDPEIEIVYEKIPSPKANLVEEILGPDENETPNIAQELDEAQAPTNTAPPPSAPTDLHEIEITSEAIPLQRAIPVEGMKNPPTNPPPPPPAPTDLHGMREEIPSTSGTCCGDLPASPAQASTATVTSSHANTTPTNPNLTSDPGSPPVSFSLLPENVNCGLSPTSRLQSATTADIPNMSELVALPLIRLRPLSELIYSASGESRSPPSETMQAPTLLQPIDYSSSGHSASLQLRYLDPRAPPYYQHRHGPSPPQSSNNLIELLGAPTLYLVNSMPTQHQLDLSHLTGHPWYFRTPMVAPGNIPPTFLLSYNGQPTNSSAPPTPPPSAEMRGVPLTSHDQGQV